MIIRQFTPAGIQAFRSFLAICRERPSEELPSELLQDKTLTEPVEPRIIVEQRPFVNRRDAAVYLTKALASLNATDVAANAGLWSWLSLFYFDQVCPPADGMRFVKNDYFYVFEPRNPRHFYRHLLFVSWYAMHLAPTHNRLFMNVPVSSLDQVTDRVMSRLFLTRIPCMFEVLDRIYWDKRRGKARAGMVDPRAVKAGDLRNRLPVRIRQLEKTYDLFSVNADQLIEMLGAEFGHSTDRDE